MTASLILTWTTSIGLGFLVEHRRFGIATAFGVVAIPAALFVFGTLFGLPLSLISWALAGFAAVGWLFQVRRWRALEMPFLEPLHPTLILLIVVLILAVAVGPEHYTPIAWDEFSSWLYWTKQQFLADAAERSDMYISLPGYPQAWPLAMTFPHTFFSQFDGLRSISVGVIVYIAILGLTYDLVRQVISLRANYSDQFARIVAWGVTLLLASGELAWRLVPETTLIEQPQVLFLIAATLFGVLALSRPDDQLRGAAGLGAFVAVGYLVKVAMLVYIPSAIIFVVALSIQAEDWRRRTAIAGIALAPMMFAVIAWRMAGPDQLSAAASPLSVLWQIISTGQANFDGGAAILENYWDRTLRFINWARLPITLIAVVGVVLALLDRVGRIAMLALIAFIGAYIASLGFSYVFLFTGYEQEVLASLERYEEVPVRLLQYFGLLALALALLSIFHALPDGFVSRITRHRSGQIVGALACFGLLVHVGNETHVIRGGPRVFRPLCGRRLCLLLVFSHNSSRGCCLVMATP